MLGGTAAVNAMIRKALTHGAPAAPVTDADWVPRTGELVVAAMEGRRSTWQVWHVRAEAHRRVRSANIPTGSVEGLVDRVVAEVLHRSVSLARPDDRLAEPAPLRRVDGSSVYTVAGADLFTSATVLAAEQRLVATAGRTDGYVIDQTVVDLALLTSTANGVTLNTGQAALVRAMATSGARLQLAIAPAGAGKTTALQALTAAWTDGGGNVIGLAPSAAAAAQLGDHINTDKTHANSARADNGAAVVVTDTLAKLTWALEHGDPPAWVRGIGPTTLVVVDEAGMADTLSLDTVVRFVTGRGGSVRLIGDDQQLAAIGAGGVLRDIQATHGAVRLTELLRFTDPAEGNASLALRDGRPEALGFYLDHGRVHVGDLATTTEDVFAGWQTDRSHDLDSIMLAPTRDLVAQLNQQARTHRLTELASTEPSETTSGPRASVVLADDNQASAGDLVITRTNDRRLRVSATDWVKNGDRWTVLDTNNGTLRVQHTQSGRTVRLPAGYVRTSTELGYATTVHTAQGVTADSMHGLVSGEESRQQLYTMMTRGRASNHLYLQVIGDGDPHSVIHPDLVHPSTPTDVLENILAHDGSPQSATSQQRNQHDPTVRLGDATPRYVDALCVAAEDMVGPEVIAEIEAGADQLVPGLTLQSAWPTLRAHLILVAAGGDHPVDALARAAGERELNTADDTAAVLDWRLDSTGLRNTGPGPLPWLPGIPTQLPTHPVWGKYLTERAQLVTDLAADVRQQDTSHSIPDWADLGTPVPASVLQDVAVWRAAMQVAEKDRRPTGPVQYGKAARRRQQHLDKEIAGAQTPTWLQWEPHLTQISPQITADPFAPVLADRLAAISRAGLDARQLLRTAASTGSLPDDHAAAALWWRISRHLTPAAAARLDQRPILTTSAAAQAPGHESNTVEKMSPRPTRERGINSAQERRNQRTVPRTNSHRIDR